MESSHSQQKRKGKKVQEQGTCYVLIPLPSNKANECTAPYIQQQGCDKNGVLTKQNFRELNDLGASLLNRLQKKEGRKVFDRVITFGDKDILSNLTENDVLYITGHGAPNAIGNAKFGVNLSPNDLAEVLTRASTNEEGKLSALGTLKIMACNSALNKKNEDVYASSEQKKQKPKEILVESYIQSFKQAADKYFKKLDIAGYLGYISDITGAKQVRDIHTVVKFDSSDSALARARDARIFLLSKNSTKSANIKEKLEDENAEHVDNLTEINKMGK